MANYRGEIDRRGKILLVRRGERGIERKSRRKLKSYYFGQRKEIYRMR